MRKLLPVFALLTFLSACKVSKINKLIDAQSKNKHIGILLSDAKTGAVLYGKNETQTFVPASNTKILTLYAALKYLGDSIPAFKHYTKQDTLFILGTGDPTFLHQDFPKTKAFEVLKNAKTIVFSDQNFHQKSFGLGWAWDDYQDYYQAELSPFPMYGNVVRVLPEGGLNPEFFRKDFNDSNESGYRREQNENKFYFDQEAPKRPYEIPFITGDNLTVSLLGDTLKGTVINKRFIPEKSFETAFSQAKDTVLRKMMFESDNLLAEHLLLLAGQQFSDSISTSLAIKNVSGEMLKEFEGKYRWVDGSGLSRYNLFSPELMSAVLRKMYQEYPQERLFSLMAIGGKAGTLKRKYVSEQPYVFAKTGSMSGVYNESGYVIAKSGRVLIYSILRDNFINSISENAKETEELLKKLREMY